MSNNQNNKPNKSNKNSVSIVDDEAGELSIKQKFSGDLYLGKDWESLMVPLFVLKILTMTLESG